MLDKELYKFIKERYFLKYPKDKNKTFLKMIELYENIKPFKANQNIHELVTQYDDRSKLFSSEEEYLETKCFPRNLIDVECFDESKGFNPRIHWIMRMCTQYYLTKAFESMKIDMNDPNIKEQSIGKGTPGRIAKLWLGADPEDTTELGSGRWNKEPYLSYFPNTGETSIITKEVDLVSNCSHHFLPFSSLDGGKVTISYKPNKYIIGISKLQRFTNWASRRFWLQEDLTKYLGEEIKRIASTEDVYIKCEGLVHGCEKFRGPSAKEGNLTTEFKSGIFKDK